MDSNYLNNLINGYSIEECDKFEQEDRDYDEIHDELHDKISHFCMMDVDNTELLLEFEEIDVDVDENTAVAYMTNGKVDVMVTYDGNEDEFDVQFTECDRK